MIIQYTCDVSLSLTEREREENSLVKKYFFQLILIWQEEGITRTQRGLTATEKAIWHGCQGITSLRKPPFEFLQDYTAQYFGIILRFEAAAI